MGIVFRTARPGDAPRLADLCEILGHSVGPEEARARLEVLSSGGRDTVLVAELDGAVVGFAQVGEECTLTGGRTAILRGLAVLETAQGRGVGSGLVAAVEEWSRARGVVRLRVRARTSRERARSFYASRGFAEVTRQVLFRRSL